MNQDVWGKLWEIAIGDTEMGAATITVDVEHCGEVTLTWPDGTRSYLYWEAGGWQFGVSFNSAPCDVSARDTF